MWYQKHIPDVKIVLLTDDKNNKKIALSEKILAYSGILHLKNYIQFYKLLIFS